MTRIPSIGIPSIPRIGASRSGGSDKLTLTEDDRKSLIRQAGEVGIGGIATVGNLLDITGSAARDLLGGENPLDQLFSPTTSKNRLTGRDLNRKYGLAGRKDTYANFLGGIATEIATDPLTYLTLGGSALSRAGQMLKSAGGLGDVAKVAGKGIGKRQALQKLTLKDMVAANPELLPKLQRAAKGKTLNMDEALGGTIGYGLGAAFGKPSGVLSSMRAAKGLDAAGELIRYGKYSPIRPIAGVLGRGLMGMNTKFGQQAAKTLTSNTRRAVVSARDAIYKAHDAIQETKHFDVDELVKAGWKTEDAQQEILERHLDVRAYLEGVEGGRPLPENIRPIYDTARKSLDEIIMREEAAGLKANWLDDVIDAYFPRRKQNIGIERGKSGVWGLFADMAHGFQKARDPVLKNHVGGTRVLMEISVDDAISGIAHTGTNKGVLPKSDLDAAILRLKTEYGSRLFDPSQTPTEKQWRDLAGWAANLDPKYAKTNTPIFELDPMHSLLQRLESGERAILAADELTNILVENAGTYLPQNTGVQLGHFIDGLQGIEPSQFKIRMTQAMKESGKYTDFDYTNLNNLYVPPDIAADAKRFVSAFNGSDATNAILNMYDKFTQLFKTSVTAIWPRFHGRNLLSGATQNWIGGAFSPEDLAGAHNFLIGKQVKGIGKVFGMSDAKGTEELRKLLFSHQVVHDHMGLVAEDLGGVLTNKMGIPGRGPIFQPKPANTTIWDRMNPFNIAGVGSTTDVFTPTRLGRGGGQYIEGLNRIQPFITLLKRGVDPEEAAKRVGVLQVDYMSKAAADPVMKRLFPFYSFTRGVLPFFIEQLVERPGGKLGRGIITAARSHNPHEVTPDYVAETASIPFGQREDGTQTYLTGIGVMAEDPLSFIGKGFSGGLREAASRMNPLPKMAVELATGQSLFQSGPLGGRPLGELDPPIGRTIANIKQHITGEKQKANPFISRGLEFASANLPYSSSIVNTARQITDTRKSAAQKALTLSTGVRVTDVSPAAQKALLSERAESVLKKLGARDFRKVYIPQDTLAELPPEKRKLALQFNALMKEQTLR